MAIRFDRRQGLRAGVATVLAALAGGTRSGRADHAQPPVGPAPCHDLPTLISQLDQKIAEQEGVYGIVLMRPGGELLYGRNLEVPFIAASLYKLVVMADVEARIEVGDVHPDDEIEIAGDWFEYTSYEEDSYYSSWQIGSMTTVEEAMFAAGALSSNVGARALLSLTTPESLRATAAAIGMRHTHVKQALQECGDWPPLWQTGAAGDDLATSRAFIESQSGDGWAINLTTPLDVARYFDALVQGTLVSHRASQSISSILGRQMINDRFPALLPEGTRVVHKTGNLDGVVHDAGIIFTPGGPVILVVLGQVLPGYDDAVLIEQELAWIVYDGVPPPTAHGICLPTPTPVDIPDGLAAE